MQVALKVVYKTLLIGLSHNKQVAVYLVPGSLVHEAEAVVD